MPLKNSTKNNAAVLLGIIWSVGISIFAVYSFVVHQTYFASIAFPIVVIHSTYKFHGQIRGESRVSPLSFFLFFGGLCLVISGLLFQPLSYYVPILLLIGALHVVVGYWAYQNSTEEQSNRLPGLNQLDTDYEIINFTNVGELVLKMKAGDWDAIDRGEYKIEVSDAALQVIAEQTLRRCLAAIHLSKSNPNQSKFDSKKHLEELVNELDQGSMYQLHPLCSDEGIYLEYFYFNDLDLRNEVQIILAEILPELDYSNSEAFEKLETEYFENTPCAKYWPIISKYL
jgi:membrane protein implicated in regulation of membrane protease activity